MIHDLNFSTFRHYDNNNNEGLLNTCCRTKCELIHVYNLKVEKRNYKNSIYLKLI